jgi:hypothetical protein
MAIVAGDVNMGAIDREISLSVVIEQPQVPRDWIVAGLAQATEIVVVRIVVQMTTLTRGLGIDKYLRQMAGVALDIVVLSKKREKGQAVVEQRRVLPACFSMAVLTLTSLRTFVHIVVQVTRLARRSRRRFENRLDVTIIAGNLLVGSIQNEI